MPTQSVAIEEDVVTEASSTHEDPNYQGTWSVARVKVESYDHLTIAGHPVVHTATVKFSFTGHDTSNNSSVTDKSTITLSASPSILTFSGGAVLVDGDSENDTHGNTVRIASIRHLKTA